MIQLNSYKIIQVPIYETIDIYGGNIYIYQEPYWESNFTQTFGFDLLSFFKKNNQISQNIVIQDNQLSGKVTQTSKEIYKDDMDKNISIDFNNIFNLIDNLNISYQCEDYISLYDGMSYFGNTYSLQYNVSVEKLQNDPNINQDKDFSNINNMVKNVLFLDRDMEEVYGKRNVSYDNGTYIETRFYSLVDNF